MITKDIAVNGTVFHCPVVWTVDQAEARIRSGFALHGGFIQADGKIQLGSTFISNITGTLTFVGGQPVQIRGKFPSIAFIQFLILSVYRRLI